jgi:hypothetical protein
MDRHFIGIRIIHDAVRLQKCQKNNEHSYITSGACPSIHSRKHSRWMKRAAENRNTRSPTQKDRAASPFGQCIAIPWVPRWPW